MISFKKIINISSISLTQIMMANLMKKAKLIFLIIMITPMLTLNIYITEKK